MLQKNMKTKPNNVQNLRPAPPHSAAVEKAMLFAFLVEPKRLGEITLPAEAFYLNHHRAVYETMREISDRGQVPEVYEIASRLQADMFPDKNPLIFLSELGDKIPTTAKWETWADLLEDRLQLRKLLELSSRISDMAFSSMPATICIEEAEKQVMELRKDEASQVCGAKDAMIATMKWLEDRVMGESAPTTGLPALDEKWKAMPGRLTFLAARPRIGKTALSLNILRSFCEQGSSVLCFSMEMTKEELLARLVSSVSGVNVQNVIDKQDARDYELHKITSNLTHMARWPMFIDDSGRLSLSELSARARQIVSRHGGVKLIIIDYIQLMRGDGRIDSRQSEVEEISRGLKALAKELDTHIFALAQLNRELEKRKDQQPKLSDLRDSGSLEQDADSVLLLHRQEDEYGELYGEGFLTVAKNRHGKQGRIPVTFDGATQMFWDSSSQGE